MNNCNLMYAQGRIAGLGLNREAQISGQILSDPVTTEISDLGMITISLREQLGFAAGISERVRILADGVGGAIPTDATGSQKGNGAPTRLSELNELVASLSAELLSINSDISRLQRLVG